MMTEAEEKVRELEKQLTELEGSRLTASDMFSIMAKDIRAKNTIIIVLIVCWLLTVAGFIWFLTLPEEETVYVENEDGNTAYFSIVILYQKIFLLVQHYRL